MKVNPGTRTLARIWFCEQGQGHSQERQVQGPGPGHCITESQYSTGSTKSICAEFAPLPTNGKIIHYNGFHAMGGSECFNCVLFCMPQVAEFTDPDWGIKSTPAWGWRTSPPGYISWRAGTTTLCRSLLYTHSGIFEFGYWTYCKVVEVRMQNVKVTNYDVMAINASND
jgi:hypothetical protein